MSGKPLVSVSNEHIYIFIDLYSKSESHELVKNPRIRYPSRTNPSLLLFPAQASSQKPLQSRNVCLLQALQLHTRSRGAAGDSASC